MLTPAQILIAETHDNTCDCTLCQEYWDSYSHEHYCDEGSDGKDGHLNWEVENLVDEDEEFYWQDPDFTFFEELKYANGN